MLNEQFLERTKYLKESYYQKVVKDLKTSNVSTWYSKVKRMSRVDSKESDIVQVHEIMHLPSSVQAEIIAENFGKISNEYEPLKTEDVDLKSATNSTIYPLFEPFEIHKIITKMKNKKSTILSDIPWRIIKVFSVELAETLANIFNSCTIEGVWPQIWKDEIIIPIPKVYPPQSTDDLRRISGTKYSSKIYESLLSDFIISDISAQIDNAQYGNEKGLSTTHYLINMVHRILTAVDKNNSEEKYAVIAQLADWSKAFDRQDPNLGIDSFIRCGVRASLIPTLISFFQQRRMTIKWQGHLSTTRDLPGGVPQGNFLATSSTK